jgi:hypothetical protein
MRDGSLFAELEGEGADIDGGWSDVSTLIVLTQWLGAGCLLQVAEL